MGHGAWGMEQGVKSKVAGAMGFYNLTSCWTVE
jgi:hypothetical protein